MNLVYELPAAGTVILIHGGLVLLGAALVLYHVVKRVRKES